MIIKGRIRTDGAELGDYLLSEGRYAKNQGENERIEVWEAPGFEKGLTLQDLLASHELSAEPTRCGKPLFHVQLRTAEGEELTRAQWVEAADRLEQRLGLANHERVLVAHTKDGQEHLHIVWNRINRAEQIAAPLHYYKHKCTDVARELERDFGLRELAPARGRGKLSRDEEQQALRQEAKPQEIREAIQACWAQADDGKSFAAALQERGFLLAQGDRRDYVAVDERGGTYSIGKRTTGAPAKAVRERLADLAQAKLPSVAEAQARQREAMQQRESAETDLMAQEKARDYSELKVQQARQEAPSVEQLAQENLDEQVRQAEAMRQRSEDAERFMARQAEEEQQKKAAFQQDDDRRREAYREEEQRKQETQQEAAHRQESARVERLAEENRDEQVRQAETMRQRAEEAERYRQHREQMAREDTLAREYRRRDQELGISYREADLSNAHYRYGQALAHYDIRDPYGSLAQCAMAEHSMFMAEQRGLDQKIATTQDPTAREALELRKRIEGMEYLAITSERIARQSEVITGERDSAEALKHRERAAVCLQQAKELRQEFREVEARRVLERQDRQEAAKQQAAAKAQEKQAAQEARREEARQQQARRGAATPGKEVPPQTRGEEVKGKEAAPDPKPLMVKDKNGQQRPLVDFVRSAPEVTRPQSRYTVSPEVIARAATLTRNEGLDGISRALERDRPLAADDVRKLKPEDREGIRKQGDAHLREMVKQRGTERQAERQQDDTGRDRDR